MKNSIRKFLEFNGRAIYFLNKEGKYWVAVRPIVEALKLDHTWQLRQLKKHPIWGDAYEKQPMRDSKNRLQEMVALPEKYIYLWIAQLPIKTEGHELFVKECVDILFDYFHGAIAGRKEALTRKAEIQVEKKELQKLLMEDQNYQKYQDLAAEEMREGKKLLAMDAAIIQKQLNLFQS